MHGHADRPCVGCCGEGGLWNVGLLVGFLKGHGLRGF